MGQSIESSRCKDVLRHIVNDWVVYDMIQTSAKTIMDFLLRRKLIVKKTSKVIVEKYVGRIFQLVSLGIVRK